MLGPYLTRDYAGTSAISMVGGDRVRPFAGRAVVGGKL